MDIVRIIKQGIYSSVQDSGRRGFRRFGMPVSGAADPYAYICGNRILGNPDGYPSIEIAGPGFECEFLQDAMVCVTGADLVPELNGHEILQGQALRVKKGDSFRCAGMRRGLRSYLSAKGGITSGDFMGSASMQKGQRLECDEILHIYGSDSRETVEDYDESYIRADGNYIVRIRKGYDSSLLRHHVLDEFTVTPYHDRMGIMLTCNDKLGHKSRIVSKAVFPGCIQLPGNGEPIIIMNDGQTTGGYPVIAVIENEDMRIAGQLKAGDTIKFSYVKNRYI